MLNPEFKKENFKKELKDAVRLLFRTTLEDASAHQIYQAVWKMRRPTRFIRRCAMW